MVWQIDPRARTVEVLTAPEQSMTLFVDQTLDGGAVLPGLHVPLRDLCAELDLQGEDVDVIPLPL
ncbi:MAG: hypothetical protein FJZ47_03310 [Candidatus Tectomicrobia bacterium]|uniref:Uncharacterized protein n=1 Tax=Tectimicrobiota bacterium TaxID=2528274 RepID=A0A937W062_UNCTE|nr:hypothetical protein [Candidatus Tectomicrobia bacterium]